MLMAECVRGLDFTVKASDNFRQCPRAAKDGKSKPASGLCTQPREAQGAPSNERQALFRRRHRPAPTRSDKKGRALVTVRCGTLLLFTLLRLLLPERQQPIPAARDGVSLNLRTSSQQGGTGGPRRFASQRVAAHSLDTSHQLKLVRGNDQPGEDQSLGTDQRRKHQQVAAPASRATRTGELITRDSILSATGVLRSRLSQPDPFHQSPLPRMDSNHEKRIQRPL